MNVPLVDVFTLPKSRTAIAAFVAEDDLLYINAACAEIVAEVKLKFAKSTNAVEAVALVAVSPMVGLVKVAPPLEYVPEFPTSLAVENAVVFPFKVAELVKRARLIVSLSIS